MIFIGDIHGRYDDYLKIARQHKSSIQVGDMGFSYNHFDGIDPKSHVFIAGNHDNFDRIESCPNYLGRFGQGYDEEIGGFFYVSGAYSIDQWHRTEGKSWWRNEELSYDESSRCLTKYVAHQPDIVVSHDCPGIVSAAMFNKTDKTRTRQLLGEMFARWKPRYHIFGHWHESRRMEIQGTKFICLAELETLDHKVLLEGKLY
jgi:Icc-related predicted phosphoesterase